MILRRFRAFSIASLLVFMSCIGGYLGGFRIGYEHGELEKTTDQSQVARTHFVGDLASCEPELNDLQNLIQKTFDPNNWNVVGGTNSILRASNDTFVIWHTGEGHDQLANLFDLLREARQPPSP